eukprot:8284148-Pyramimonas_sp.AAC.1
MQSTSQGQSSELVAIGAQAQVSYLGVDLGGGRRLARAVRRRRLEMPALISAKVARHAQASKKYKVTARVEHQGPLSAGSYGHQIHGAFGHAVTAFRRRQGRACAAPSSG